MLPIYSWLVPTTNVFHVIHATLDFYVHHLIICILELHLYCC